MKEIVKLVERAGNMIYLPWDFHYKGREPIQLFRDLEIKAGFRKKEFEDDAIGIDINGVKFYVSIKGNISQQFIGPTKSLSPGSQAIYFFGGIIKDNMGVLIQYLPSKSKTSCHYHEERDEIIIGLFQKSWVINCVTGEERHIWYNGIFIPRGACHQVVNPLNQPLISLIIMVGSKLRNLLGDDHHFLEAP